jgi:hypothetical protein
MPIKSADTPAFREKRQRKEKRSPELKELCDPQCFIRQY